MAAASPATTPGTLRRPAIDVARMGALAVVVAGHLTLAVVDRGPGGAIRGTNLIVLRPGWAWCTVLAPMPIFFAAGGWANATSTRAGTRSRLGTLVGLAATVTALWTVPVLVTGGNRTWTNGARIATQPLWFLGAYVPLVALSPWLADRMNGKGGATRPWTGLASVAVPGFVVAATDAITFAWDGPNWPRWVNFYAAWTVPWALGIWWRNHREHPLHPWHRRNEVVCGLALLAGGALGGAALVRWCGYHPGLIDALPGRRSNTTPPSTYTVIAALAQVGALMVAAGPLDRVGRAGRRTLARLGEVAVGVYLWHLTALSLWVGLIIGPIPVPLPNRLSGWWWATRPLWWAGVLAITAALVLLTERARRYLQRTRRRSPPVPDRWEDRLGSAGVIAAAGGGVLVGLRGPRHPALALTEVALFCLGWWLLRVRVPRPSPTRR